MVISLDLREKKNRSREERRDWSGVWLPEMTVTACRTGVRALVRQVLHISAGARGVQAVDQVGGIDVRQGLGGDDFDPAGPLEMFHQISLSSFTTEDVGNLGSPPP